MEGRGALTAADPSSEVPGIKGAEGPRRRSVEYVR